MLSLVVMLLASDPVTAKNWLHHPQIEEVRKLVAEVDDAVKAHQLSTRERTCELETRTLQTDAHGVVRKYIWNAGSDDSADVVTYYYDGAGQLRFVVSTGGAVPNAHRESRAWFDDKGKKLWHSHSFTGQGMDWDPSNEAQYLIRDPTKHYGGKPIHAGPDACAELAKK